MKKTLVVLFGAVFGLLLFSRQAFALDCDTTVVDGAGVYGTNISRVVDATKALTAKAADVRVRTVTNYGGAPNLDQYKASVVRACPSWQALNGNMKNNMVVLMISTGNTTGSKVVSGLYYGSTWATSLDAQWPTIQAQNINPYLRQNSAGQRDFVGASVNGLNTVAANLIAQGTNPTIVRPTPVQPAPPPVVVQSQPTNLNGLWAVMGGGLGLVAIGAVVWLLVARSKKRDIARAAQDQAKAAKNACSAKIIEYQDTAGVLLIPKVDALARKTSEEDVVALRTDADGIKALYNNAASRFAEYGSSATDPDTNGLSAEQYTQIAAGYDGIRGDLDNVRQGLEFFETKRAAIERVVGQAPQQVADAKNALAQANAAIDAVQEKGFKTECTIDTMKLAGDFLKLATDAVAAKHYGKVGDFCAKATAEAKKATDAANALPKAKAYADETNIDLEEELAELLEMSPKDISEIFQQLTANYAPTSWSDIKDKPEEIDRAFAAANEKIVAAKEAASMNQQDWSRSAALAAEAQNEIDKALDAHKVVVDRKRELDEAKANAPKIVEEINAGIITVEQYVNAHTVDVGTAVDRKVSEMMASLNRFTTLLAEKMPDYLAVVAAGNSTKSAINDALAAANEKVAAAEAERQRAVSAIEAADRQIHEAERYIDANRGDVGATAGSRCSEANAVLAKARQAKSLQERINLADQAKSTASSAIDAAQADIDRREAEREEQRERVRAAERAAAAERQLEEERAARRRAESDSSLLTGVVIGSALSNSGRRDDNNYGGGGYSGGGYSGGSGYSSGGDSGGGSSGVDDSSSGSSWGGDSGGGSSGSSDSGSSGGGDSGGGSSGVD